MIELIIVTCT